MLSLTPESATKPQRGIPLRNVITRLVGCALGLATVATILTSGSSANPNAIDHQALNDARVAGAARNSLTYGYLLGRESVSGDIKEAEEKGYLDGVEGARNKPEQEVGALLGFTSDGYRVAIVDADPSSDVELDNEGKVVCYVNSGLTVSLDLQMLDTERVGGKYLYDILQHGNFTTPFGETVSIAGTYDANGLCDEVLAELSNPQDNNKDGELPKFLENASGL